MGYDFDFALVLRFIPFILKGLQFTLLVSATAFALAVLIGLAVALLRLTGNRVLNAVLSLYVDVFRSLPQLIALFWFFYAIPILSGLQPSALLSASVALGVITGAGISELFRGGILSLPRGQREAAYAMGMTTTQVYRRVILPQAIVQMLPPLGSFAISTVKASALASIIGVADLMWQGDAMTLWTFRRVEVFTVIAVVYFFLTYPIAIAFNKAHERLLAES
jgi:polar amino acid transport system permease protein